MARGGTFPLHATCASRAEAEREAKELLAGAHGGEVVIYDSRWRVHAVKRFGGWLGLE